jgi:hypothetical protein
LKEKEETEEGEKNGGTLFLGNGGGLTSLFVCFYALVAVISGVLANCVQRIPIVNPNPPCGDYLDTIGALSCVADCGDDVQCVLGCVIESATFASGIETLLACTTKDGVCSDNGGDPDIPLLLGYNMRELFICEEGVPPSDATCVSDNFETDILQRKGSYAQLLTKFVKLGGVLSMLTLPGELAPELAVGLPLDFDSGSAAVDAYYKKPEQHTVGADYMAAPGVLETMMNCSSTTPCMFIGLGMDELGYMVPYDDFRIACLGEVEECEADFEKGAMTYRDSMSAEECEKVVSDEAVARDVLEAEYGKETADRVIQACKYGQVRSNDGQHYEEQVQSSSVIFDIHPLHLISIRCIYSCHPLYLRHIPYPPVVSEYPPVVTHTHLVYLFVHQVAGSWDAVPMFMSSVSSMLGVPLEGRYMSEERNSWQVRNTMSS